MPRIHYIVASDGGLTGGQKMAVRHVETLRELGFDAYCYINRKPPGLIEHQAPFSSGRIEGDDIVVAADDDPNVLLQRLQGGTRIVVFAQNPYQMSATGFAGLDALSARGILHFMAVGSRLARTLRRLYPSATIDLVRCFADERRFHPRGTKQWAVAYSPRKRRGEAMAIGNLFRGLHPAHADLEWSAVQNATELETAQTFARSGLFLSLSRLESVGITTLEAMASGCLCAGFTGVGGQEYATPDNGFWVPDDDCEAAADALAEAAAIFKEGGPELSRRREAGFETARAWSQVAFRQELEAFWSKVAPDARTLGRVNA